ncbi:hypothetical protein K438DRAFT_1748802 [Mycena galopus ATCC 62051]|nr:hypothetical protein K438DRAFT_1748802 [Mycena galopus ATCC 62051]
MTMRAIKTPSRGRAELKGMTIGAEFSGVVVEAGSGCQRTWKAGDRAAGSTFPSNPTMADVGSHAEYVLAKGDMMLRLDAMGPVTEALEQGAAGVGIALMSVFVALYRELGLPLPDFARAASPKRCSCTAQAPARAGELDLVLGCIGMFESPRICAGVMASGARYSGLIPAEFPREDITVVHTVGQVALGETLVRASQTRPANQELFEEAVRFTQLAERYVKEGKVVFPPVKVSSGLGKVLDRMQDLRGWKISATKHVCSVSEDQ